jgi:hypothetical protein
LDLNFEIQMEGMDTPPITQNLAYFVHNVMGKSIAVSLLPESVQQYNDLQQNVWRDVDRMMEFSSKESQTLAEQLRRKRMKSLCTQLESLLPATPAKVITTLARADTVFQGFILYVQKRVMVNLPKLFSVS